MSVSFDQERGGLGWGNASTSLPPLTPCDAEMLPMSATRDAVAVLTLPACEGEKLASENGTPTFALPGTAVVTLTLPACEGGKLASENRTPTFALPGTAVVMLTLPTCKGGKPASGSENETPTRPEAAAGVSEEPCHDGLYKIIISLKSKKKKRTHLKG